MPKVARTLGKGRYDFCQIFDYNPCRHPRPRFSLFVFLLTPSHPHWPTDRALVFQKVEALTAIECKLLVTLKEREVLGDGVGNENVVAGVVVVLSLVEREMGVSELGSL